MAAELSSLSRNAWAEGPTEALAGTLMKALTCASALPTSVCDWLEAPWERERGDGGTVLPECMWVGGWCWHWEAG